MTKRIFTTKDAYGCYFKVTAYYPNKRYEPWSDRVAWEEAPVYEGMGYRERSLCELKKKVSQV